MTTLRPFRRIRQSVAIISLAAMLSSQIYLSAADFYLIRRADGLNSIFSYAERDFPLGLGDRILVSDALFENGAITTNAFATNNASLTVGALVLGEQPPLPDMQGTITNGSNVVSGVASTAALQVGMNYAAVSNLGAGTISEIISSTSFRVFPSADPRNATGSGLRTFRFSRGALTLQANANGASVQTMVLGAGGIDMSASQRNLTINRVNGGTRLEIATAAAQTWTVGLARSLAVAADIVGNHQLTLQNTPTTSTILGSGTGTIAITGRVDMNAPLVVNQQGGVVGSSAISFSPTLGHGGVFMNGNAITINNTGVGNVTFSNTVDTPTIITNASQLNYNSSSTGRLILSGNLASSSGTAININNSGASGVVAELTGVIGGASTTLNIVNQSATTVQVSGNNTFGGGTSVSGGTLELRYVAAAGSASKLSDTGLLTLSGATLLMSSVSVGTPAVAGTHSEVVGGLHLGLGYSNVNNVAATPLFANGITRASGGVVNVAAGLVRTDNLNTNGILGGWSVVGGGADWGVNATNGADGLINALGSTANDTNPALWTAAQNVRLTASTGSAVGNATINSMLINSAAATTVSQTAGTLLTIDSGGIIAVGGGTKAIGVAGGSITAGTAGNAAAFRAGASSSDLFIHATGGAVTLDSTIVDNALLPGSTAVGLVKTQAGTLVLSANNTYTGGTVIGGGTLQLGVGAAGGATGSLGSGDVLNNGTIVVNRNNAVSLANNISGSGGLTLNIATGVTTLSGNNTYRGATTVNRGILVVGSANALSPNSSVAMVNDASAKLQLNGFNANIGGLSGGGATGGNVELGGNTLTVGSLGVTQTFSGIISGVGGSIVKEGLAKLTLSATTSTYTGSLTVNGGELEAAGNNSLSGASVNNGILRLTGSTTFAGPVVVNAGGAIFGGAATSTTFNGGLTVGAAGTFTLNGIGLFNSPVIFNQTADTVLASTTTSTFQSLTVNAGNLTMAGNVTALTALNINGGSVNINRAGGVVSNNAPIVMAGSGTFLNVNESEVAGSLTGEYGSQVTVASGRTLQIGSSNSSNAFDGVITGAGAVVKEGTGAWSLGGGNGFTGGLTIAAGSVVLSPNTPLINRPEMLSDLGTVTVAAGANLDLQGRSERVGGLAGAGNVLLGTDGTIQFGANGTSSTMSGVISGTGKAVKEGSGITSLTGMNTFTGMLDVSGGILEVAHAGGNALSDSLNVFVRQAGSTFQVGASGETVGKLSGAPGSILQLNGQLTAGYTNGSVLEVFGTATSGSPLWTGLSTDAAIPLSVGMRIANSNFITDPSWVVQISGSDTVLLSNPAQSPGGQGALNFTPVSVLASNSSGIGGITKNGTGTLVITGKLNHSGPTVINAGEVQAGGFESGGRFVWQNVLSDNSQLVFGSTGTQVLNLAASATNLFTFERIGSLAGGAGFGTSINLIENSHTGVPTSANTGTLALGGDNQSSTFFGAIRAIDPNQRAWVIKEGTGTFTYSNGDSTGFQGVARVEDGTWHIPAGTNGLSFTGASLYLSNKAGAIFDNEISESVDILAGGSGVRTRSRSGVAGVLTGNYLNQHGGEIKLTGTGSELVVTHAILPSMSYSGVISGSGGLVKNGTAELNLLNTNTYTGQTFINAGSLNLGFLSATEGVGDAVLTERKGSLSPNTIITISAGIGLSFFNTNSMDTMVGDVRTPSVNGYVTVGRGTLTITNASGFFRGSITNSGGLAKTGEGLANIGTIRITGGTLELDGGGARIAGPSVDLRNSARLIIDNSSASGALADTTRVNLGDTSVLEFGSSITEERIGSLSGSGTVELGADRTLIITRGGGDTHGVFSGSITGTGTSGLVLAGGSLVLKEPSGGLLYTGATKVQDRGVLILDGGLGAGTSNILPDTGELQLAGGTIRLRGDKVENPGSVSLLQGVTTITRDITSDGTLALGIPTIASGAGLMIEGGGVTTSLDNDSTGILGGFAVYNRSTWAAKEAGSGEVRIGGLPSTAFVNTLGVGSHTSVVNDLNVDGSATTATLNFGLVPADRTVNIDGILTLSSGGIMVTRDASNFKLTLARPAGAEEPSSSLQSSVHQFFVHQFNQLAPLIIGVPLSNVSGVNPASFTKTGAGTVIFAAQNTQTGPITIGQGTLQVGNADGNTGRLSSSSATLQNDGILAFSRSGVLTVDNPIIGSGAVRVLGSGTIQMTGLGSSYSGRTNVISGSLLATSAGSLGTAAGGTSVESGALLEIGTDTEEPVALKGGTLSLQGNFFDGRLTVLDSSSVLDVTSTDLNFDAPILIPFMQSSGDSLTITQFPSSRLKLTDPTYVGNLRVQGGSLHLARSGNRSGYIPGGAMLDLVGSSTRLVVDVADAFRTVPNEIVGTGGVRILSNTLDGEAVRQVWLTGNNTYTGGTSVGVSESGSATLHAVLHIGADSFTGSIGSGNLVVESSQLGNSQVRTHRHDTLLIPGDILLSPGRNVNGTTGYNADFVRQGMGNVILSGTITSGPLGAEVDDPENSTEGVTMPGPERALFTSDGSGRLIFANATMDSTTNGWGGPLTSPGPIAINNNGQIEFNALDDQHEYEIAGALGGGGNWVFNSPGTVRLNNQHKLTLGGWSGNAFIHKGTLETETRTIKGDNQVFDSQIGTAVDIFVTSSGKLHVKGEEVFEVLSSTRNAQIEIDTRIRLTGGERMNFGDIAGGGSLELQGSTTHLYSRESTYSGLTSVLNNGVLRVGHLANNNSPSSIGSGDTVTLGQDATNGTLDFVGSGNDSTNRTFVTNGGAGTSATVQVSGPGSITLTGTIEGGLPTQLDANNVQVRHTFNLAGDSVETNVFSGNISITGAANSFVLRKAGSGTWRMTGTRPSFNQLVQISAGVLEIDSINALGNLGVTRSILLNGGTLRRYDNGVSGTETFASNVTFLSTGGNSSIINDDLNTALVINGAITQDTSTGASSANRTITLGGDSGQLNIVGGGIVGENLGLSKAGASTWQLNGNNNFLQGGTISGGTLIVNTANGGLGDNGNYFLSNANGILNIGTGTYSRLVFNFSDTIGSLQGNFGSRVELPNVGTTLTLRAGSQTFAGLITGAGGIKVTTNANAARIATFNQKNTYTGPTQIVSDVGSAVGGNRIDVFHLANGGLASGIGASSSAAANLVLATKTGGGGLRFAGFTANSTDRLFTLGAGAGAGSAEAAGALWADGAVVGTSSATIRFTNTGALAYTDSGNRRLVFRGGNRGTKTYDSLGISFVSQSFNEFSPIIADGPGGVTSIRKLEDSVWLLKGANTYTGDVRIERGTLSIGHNTALGTSAGGVVVAQSNNDTRAFLDLRGVTVTGEALTLISGANNSGNGWGASSGTNVWTGSVTNNVASRWAILNDQATPLATTSLRVDGNIGGFGAISVVGNGTLILGGNNTFTGQVTAAGKVLGLDYSTNNNSKLPNGVALILGGTGNVAVQGSSTRGQDNAFFQTGTTIQLMGGSHTEIVNGVTINAGASYVKRIGGSSILEMRGLSRAALSAGTLDVESGVTTTTTGLAGTTNIIGGYMTVGATDWATKTGNSIIALGTYESGEGANNNINVTNNLSIASANTLRFNVAAPITLSLTDATVLSAGGILITPNVGSNQITIGGSTLTSGTASREIIVHQHSPTGVLRINSNIINGSSTVALTKSGPGLMILGGNNTYTAGTFVNEGTLQVGVNGSAATLGTGVLHLNGRIVFDHSGAEWSSGSTFRGNGILELAQTNTRTVVFTGDSGGFQGTIIVAGGTLAGVNHGNALGNGRTIIRVTEANATVDLRNTNENTTTPNSGVELYLGGRLMTSTGNSTLAGSLHVVDEFAQVEVSSGAQLALSGIIYSQYGLTKTGAGRLLLSNGNLFADAPEGSTTRSLNPTLNGVISVMQGELWLPGGGRSAGATGPGNEIMVSPGASLDLRGAGLNYGDDADPLRKYIVAEGIGNGGTGALKNTSGTAVVPYLEVIGDLTIGTGGFFNGARIDFNAYDTSPITGSLASGVTDLVAAQVKAIGFNSITKVGTGDLVFRDTEFDQFDRLEISEGEVRFERNTPPNVGTGGIDLSMFNQIALRYAGPSRLDATNLNSPTGPILGSRLEFYRQKDVQHVVPILMDGTTSWANGAANYVELNSDAAIPGPATFLSGGIEVLGPAHANIFNVESGTTTGVVTAQGNQTSEVQGKLIVDNAIYGDGGISKIGFRELRLLDKNFYTGETIVSRSGNIAAPPRSDAVTVNGTTFQNLGIAESWGEFGLTLTGNGAISSSSAVRLDRNGLITLDNSTRLDASSNTTTSNLNDRINNAANLFLRMGTIRIIGSESENNTEALATTGGAKLNLVAGTNNIDLWTSDLSGMNLTLTIGELTRAPGSVLRIRNFDATSTFTSVINADDSVRVALTTAPSAAAGLAQVGSGASATSRSIVTGVFGGIAPHMIYEDTRLVTDLYTQGRNLQNATGSHFMTYDGGFLRPLDDSEYHVPTSGLVEAAAAGQNVNLSEINHFTRSNTAINSLRFGPVADNNGSGTSTNDRTTLTSYTNNWTPSLFIDDYATLTVSSGMVASATFGVGPSQNNSTFIRGGTLDFGNREGIISNQNYWLRLTGDAGNTPAGVYGTNNFEIQSRITGSGGVTKVGAPSVVFDAANNYTGVTTINEGVLFARNARSALGQGGAGNGISLNGTGELRLTNGVLVGSASLPKDLQVGVLVNDGQQILRSENGNNFFFGDIIYDNVDSVLHANPAARPRVTANTNQALTIVGDIYGGSSAVTAESYYSGSRIITLEGAGFITIKGQIGDRGVSGNARAAANPITAGLGTASLTNQNQLFRLHIATNQDLNVTLDRQYNAAGRLALDQGVLIINYDPAAAGNDGTGFWTTEAITKLAGVPVAAAAVPSPPALAELGNSNSTGLVTLPNGQVFNQGNNGATMHGFGLGSGIAGAGNQAVFMTKPGQRFNMATWTIGGSGGYAVLGGLNTSGTVTYGTGQGTLTLGGRSVRFYASAGGTVEFNHRLNGGTFIKNGLGTVVIKNNAVDQDLYDHSDTHNFEIAGGTLLIDYDGAITLRRVGNAGTFTGSGGTLIGRGFTGGTATARALDISTDTGATRTVRFLGGNTQVIAEAVGASAFTLTLGNGSNSSAVTRSEGATASFVGYNSTGGAGVGEVRMNFATGIAHQNPKNHVIHWGVVGDSPRTATDFAMVDGNNNNRVRAFMRSLDEYKNDVATWLIGEDISEDTRTSAGGSGFRGTLTGNLAINTLRFDAAASSTLNVGSGQTLQIAQSGIMVSTNTGAARKTITGGRLTSSTIVAGNVVSGSNVISNLESTNGLYVGMPVSGAGIPVGAFISEIINGNQVRMTTNATATTVLSSQGIVFGSTELVVHQYGQGNLVIESGLGDGNSFIDGLSTVNGSTTITVSTTLGIQPGMVLVGPNIPSGSSVVSVDSITTLTMSRPATLTASAGTLEVIPVRTGPAALAGATYTTGQYTVAVASTAAAVAGMVITGPGIPFGTLISSVDSSTQLTLNNPITTSASGAIVYVTYPNDTPGQPVTVTGGSSVLDSANLSVSSTADLRVGMGITGNGIPAGAVIIAIPRIGSPDPTEDTNTFSISVPATSSHGSQTYRAIAGARVLQNASVTASSSSIQVTSTVGLVSGMPVRLPHVAANATVNTVVNGTTFTVTGTPPSVTQSGLTGYAQYTGNMPAVLTGGVTSTTLGQRQLITVHTTAGLVPGLTIVGPNIPSGAVVDFVDSSTQFVITKEVTASGTDLTFAVGTQSAMPISLLASRVVSGSNKVMVASTRSIQEGLILIGPGIPAAAVVTSIESSQGFTMSVNATATSTGNTIRAVSPMALTINGPSTTGVGELGTTGAVVLKSNSGNYGGKTYVNGGVLSIESEDSLGIASAVGTNDQLTLNGGTLRWTGLNGQLSPTRGLTIGGNGGVIEIAESTGHLFIKRSIFSQDQYRGDLIKTGPGTLVFEGDSAAQANFRGLLDIREGTVRMSGDDPGRNAGTSTMFGSNISWADGTIVRSGANLMIQMGNANGNRDWNFEEFIRFEGNNVLTVGTPNGPRRPVNWAGIMDVSGPLTVDVTLDQVFRLGFHDGFADGGAGSASLPTAGGQVIGSGDIIKDGMGTLEFRENIPDWKGGLTILQGRVIGLNQGDVFGTGHLNGKVVTLGSTEHAEEAELYLQSDLGVAGSVWESNMPINVVYNPAQTKSIGVLIQPNNGMDFKFTGNITLNDNLILNYIDNDNSTPAGGEYVHIHYTGNIADGALTSGNLVLRTREGAPNANNATNGRMHVFHRFSGNNSGWSGDMVIGENLSVNGLTGYNHDQTTIARLESNNALGARNDVIMNYNTILQVAGSNVNIGSLHTLGGDGPFTGNVGTMSGSHTHSSEIIENAASTPATITINQSTPVSSEVKWDAMFRDGTLASHFVAPGQGAAAASLSVVKAGNGWATLSLDNDYTGTTTISAGILQVGAGGIGDTGAIRAANAPGLTVNGGATLAGTGVVHGLTTINGLLRPGDVAGDAIGTINIHGNVVLGNTSVTTIQIQSAALNAPELLNVPLDVNGQPTHTSAQFHGLYDVIRNSVLGATDAASATYKADLTDPVYSNHHDQVRSSGNLTLSDNAKIILQLDGYTPVAGDVFRVLQFVSISAASGFNAGFRFRFGGETGLDLDLPALGGSFMWDTSLFATRGILSVVGIDNAEDPTILSPQFKTRPQHTIVELNTPVTFEVEAFGSGNMSYTWKKGTAIIGSGTSFSTAPVTTAVIGKYSVEATSDYVPALPKAFAGPFELAAINMDGSSFYLQAGGTKTITVQAFASSASILKYQWLKDGVAIANGTKYSGVTTKTLTLKAFSANEVGNYTCRVYIPGNSGGAEGSKEGGVHQVMLLSKPEFETDLDGNLLPLPPAGAVSGSYGPYTTPVKPGANRAPTKFTATGLPTGVKIDPVTGVLSGTPDVDKTWTNIKITATNAAGSTVSKPFSIVISPLPNTAVGAFVALADRDSTAAPSITFGKGARIDLTSTKKGTFTLKFTNGTVASSAKGRLLNLGGAPTASVLVKRKAPLANLTVTFAIDSNNISTGTVTDGVTPVNPGGLTTGVTTINFNGWRNVWSSVKNQVNEATTRYGNHNLMAEYTNADVFPTPGADRGDLTKPQGVSTAIVKVVKPGKYTAVFRMGDSTAVASIAAPLGPTGQLLFYRTIYSAKQQGTVHGTATIAADPFQSVTGNMTWSKPGPATATVAKLYHNGWPTAPLALTIAGGRYYAPLALKPPTVPVGEIVMSLPAQPNNARLTFEYGKVESASLYPNLTFPFTVASTAKVTIPASNPNAFPSNPNPAALKMSKLTAATGEFIGTATLQDTDINTGKIVKRTLSYRGLIIPNVNTGDLKDGIGVGHFTLQEMPVPLSPVIQNTGAVEFDVAP